MCEISLPDYIIPGTPANKKESELGVGNGEWHLIT